MIQTIEDGTFSILTKLEAIDLSTNALSTIPPELYTLPLLRNLYVQNNNLKDLTRDLEKIDKPIAAQLQILNLAECNLYEIPNFGILPKLVNFNLSGNSLRGAELSDFSPYCNLKKVDFNNTQMNICTCRTIAAHLIKRQAHVIYNPNCNLIEFETLTCPNMTENLALFHECIEHTSEIQLKEKSSITWMSIALSLCGFFVIFIGLLYYLHRRNISHIKKRLKKQQKFKVILAEPNEDSTQKTYDTLLEIDNKS